MATYYVATTGSDGGAGTIGDPFETIQHGVDQLGAGDTLYVRGGTYGAGFEIETSGSSGNEITIAAYAGETPVVDGGWDGVTFPFTDETWGQRYNSPVKVRGDYIIVDGLTSINSTGRGMDMFYCDHSEFRNCTVRVSFNTGIEINNCTNCLAEGCEVDRASQQRKWRTKTINGVYVNNHPNVMPMVLCQDCTIRGCIVHDSGGEGIDIFRSTGCIIEDNICYNCDALLYYLNWAGDGSIVRNNIGFYTDDFVGLWLPNKTAMILRDEYQSANKQRYGPTRNAEIYNNLFIAPEEALWITGQAGMDTNTIAHNTFIATGAGYAVKVFTPKDDIPTPWQSSIIENNIFVGPASIAAHNGITWRYNNWSATPSTRAQGTGDIYDDPDLANAGAAIADAEDFSTYNYNPTAASPGIGEANAGSYTTDFYGATRTDPDMGFAEYSATGAPVAVITVPTNPAIVDSPQTLSAAASIGNPTGYAWEIDTVEVGTASTYAWTPATAKIYTIKLTVTNPYGSDSQTVYVTAQAAPGGGGGGSGTVAALLTGAIPGSTGSDGGATHTDLGTNTAGLLMVVSGATAVGTPSADSQIGIGATDGTNHRAIAAASDDANATVSAGWESQQATAYLTSPQHTMIVDGDAALTDSDTVTINWNTVSAGKLYAALRIAATNVAVGDFTPGGADVNVGFQPDVVLFFLTDDNTDFAGTGGASGNVSFGWLTADGSRSLTWRSVSGSASGAQWLLHSETYVCTYLTNTIADGISATITATGFSHSSTGSMTGKVGYLALKLDGLSTQILDFDTETATGTKSYATSFEPGAAVALASLLQAVDTLASNTTASAFSIGFWDGTNARAVAISDEDGADPTVAKSHAKNELLLIPDADGTALIDADVDSVSASALVLDYTAVDAANARKVSILLIEQAAGAGLTIYDPLNTGLRAGLRMGMN